VSTPLRLVLASANPDKSLEISAVLTAELAGRIEVLERPSSIGGVEETGDTLEAHARLKAVAVAPRAGEASVAHDTGPRVAALGGAPGVYSARYSGPNATYEDNVTKLLEALNGIEDRRARFRTVVLVAFPNGRELQAEGVVTGRIASEARGAGGFGYDPVF